MISNVHFVVSILICEVIMQGWEETIVKEEQGESPSELKISLPSLPSLYIISFLCRASEEIHRIGGHVLDKSILQKFASSLLEKVPCLSLLLFPIIIFYVLQKCFWQGTIFSSKCS